jgi:hypothetical protein
LDEQPEIVLASPQDLLEKACKAVLDGREPANIDDWVQIVDVWAYNLPVATMPVSIRIMSRCFSIPLTDSVIDQIIDYRLKRRTAGLN